MAKAGDRARRVFLDHRAPFEMMAVNSYYLQTLQQAVRDDYLETKACTLVESNILQDADPKENYSIFQGMIGWLTSEEYWELTGKQQKVNKLKQEISQLKDEKDMLERDITARRKTIGELESEYGKYKKADEMRKAVDDRKMQILDQAQQDANQVRADAEALKAQALDEARIEKERILSSARTERDRILSEARTERENIISGAHADEQRILYEAGEKARDIKAEAEAEKAAVIREYSEKIENAFPEYRKQIEAGYNADIKEIKRQFSETAEDVSSLKADLARAGDRERGTFVTLEEAMRSGMRKEADGCRTAFENAISELKASYERQLADQERVFETAVREMTEKIEDESIQRQNKVAADIQEWKTSLYKVNYRELAAFYNLFNRFLAGVERREDELNNRMLNEGSEGSNTTDDETTLREEIHTRNCSLRKLANRLNSALAGMGIVEIIPEPGDEFDYDKHMCEGDTDNAVDGASITKVIQNGLALKRPGEDDQVILQAIVEVENECDQ